MPTGRVIVQQWVSVDGFAADEDRDHEAVFSAVDHDADRGSQEWNLDLLATVDEVVLGRSTYEMFVQYWPDADELIADGVNTVAKSVVSTTVDEAPWGRHAPAAVVRDAVEHVRRRRDEGATLLVWGSLRVAAALHAAGLVDELDLFVAPILLGRGEPVLPVRSPVRLAQLASEDWGSVTHLRLAVAP